MSSNAPAAPSKPDPRLTVDVGGGPREIFMSFGLLNEISSLVGGPESVPSLSFDPSLSSTALELMLAPRDKRGKIPPQAEDADPIVPVDLSPEIAEQILDWAGAHVLDFFVRRFAKSAALLATRATNLAAVGSSLTSSETSPGKTA